MIDIAEGKKKQIQINNDLLNAVTPFGGMEFYRNKMLLGETLAKVYGIVKYPSSLNRGWASKITNLPSTITCQIFEPCDNSDLILDLSSSVSRYRQIVDTTRDALERQRAEKSASDAEKLMKRIDENGEVIGYMSNLAMVLGMDEQNLERSCRTFEGALASLNCRGRLLINNMQSAYKTISPTNVPDDEILKLTRRNVPMSTFIEGFPFASNSFVDFNGYPFGRNSKNGLVVLDPWIRGADRTNSNFIIVGIAGVGKSTVTKQLMISEFMTGTVNIAIDPESEYGELARNLGGDVVDAGGGTYIINPLQFKSVPLDDLEEKEKLYDVEAKHKASAMALHFKSLEVFFRLYANLTTTQISLLKQLLEALYNSFDIHWDTDVSQLKNYDYPILEDLYELLIDYKNSNKFNPDLKTDITQLEVILRELSYGADSFIWNGHSSVEPNSSFIVFDTSTLMETSENVKRAQYYNILTWTWERMSRDREERVMLFADEAYIMVDPQVPQSLIYLRNIAKRDRKYNAGLCVITHSVVDILDESVKLYGQALLDLPAYKVLMGTDGVNLQELSKIYSLSDYEQEILANKKRGVSIFFVGSRRFIINHEVSEYELNLMGSGGGK